MDASVAEAAVLISQSPYPLSQIDVRRPAMGYLDTKGGHAHAVACSLMPHETSNVSRTVFQERHSHLRMLNVEFAVEQKIVKPSALVNGGMR